MANVSYNDARQRAYGGRLTLAGLWNAWHVRRPDAALCVT
jgi:hypothetical protein